MRVGFYHASPFHHAMLDPVQRQLEGRAECLRCDDPDLLAAFDPRVVVLAEHYQDHLRPRLPRAEIVWTRHGFATKNYTPQALAACDYACLSSAWVRDEYERAGWQPRKANWLTGFVPTDALHAAMQRPRPAHDGATLLYAPTHNPLLSSTRGLGHHWAPGLRRDFPRLRVLLKPHPHTHERDPLVIARYRAWAEADPGIELVEGADADIYPLLADADILLTDASSVMFYFLALDRPLILYSNPRRQEDSLRFDPDGFEWRWRDMGLGIESAAALPAAVAASLAAPQAQASARARYRERLFGDLFDGRAAARVAEHVLALAA